MTYPPQQPGPYGQQPQQPGGYGYGQQQPQPDQWGGQQQYPNPQYQGFGGYPGGQPPQPPKKNTGKVVAIVVIALLVLGGAGAGVYFLTKDDKPEATTGSSPTSTKEQPTTSTSQGKPSSKPSGSQEPSESGSSAPGFDEPKGVVDAYVSAYQSKSFSSVTGSACAAYKKKYGTDTSELEGKLAGFDITATPQGDPEVKGSTASAKIGLKLAKGGQTKDANIKIKIVKETGSWRFCGEEAA